MKKILSLFILPLVALMCLTACGKDKTPADIKAYYDNMKSAYIEEETNIFFADETRPNTISFAYNDTLNEYINTTYTANLTDVQKSYITLGYQQKVLNNAFSFYETYEDEFYRVMSSADYKKSEINNLYSSLETLNKTLDDFKTQYSQFMSDFKSDNFMSFSLYSYAFQLNKVIDKSFDFIYNFIDVYNNYVAGEDKLTSVSVGLKIDISTVDIANVIYLENIKPFNYSVGERGICNMVPLINEKDNDYNIISLLTYTKHIASNISSGLNESSATYDETVAKVNDFIYSRDVMKQRLSTYKGILSSLDVYKLTEYRFGLVGGVDYDTYKSTLSASDKADVVALENFINDIFKPFVAKMDLIAV